MTHHDKRKRNSLPQERILWKSLIIEMLGYKISQKIVIASLEAIKIAKAIFPRKKNLKGHCK